MFHVRQLDLDTDSPCSAHNNTLENMSVFGCHCALERENRHLQLYFCYFYNSQWFHCHPASWAGAVWFCSLTSDRAAAACFLHVTLSLLLGHKSFQPTMGEQLWISFSPVKHCLCKRSLLWILTSKLNEMRVLSLITESASVSSEKKDCGKKHKSLSWNCL